MAKVIKRKWLSHGPNGHRVRKVAWGYTLQVNGKQERRFDAAWSRQDAQEALAARLLERDAPKAPEKLKTFDEVAQEYLDFKKRKRSFHDDELMLKRLLAWFGTETSLSEVTAHRIAQYQKDRSTKPSRRGTDLAPASLNRELALLRHLLRLAEEWGYLDKVPKIRLAKEQDGRLRFLTEAEIARLLEACACSKNPYLTSIVTLALNTGMRKGEILGLSWERVDLSRGVLLLEQTKSGRRREVPMNRAVYDELQPLYAEARAALPAPKPGEEALEPEGLVFRRANGDAWGNIRTAFERACREARIENFRFHDLRHTCASWLVMRGRSLKEVQEILGHREFGMTLRYAHLAPDRLRDAVSSLEDFSTNSAQSVKIDPACLVSA